MTRVARRIPPRLQRVTQLPWNIVLGISAAALVLQLALPAAALRVSGSARVWAIAALVGLAGTLVAWEEQVQLLGIVRRRANAMALLSARAGDAQVTFLSLDGNHRIVHSWRLLGEVTPVSLLAALRPPARQPISQEGLV